MALYRNVQTTFWTDSKIDNEFTPDDKYFYLYLFTNPHTNLAGCYEIGIKQMAYETGLSNEKAKNLLERITKHHKVAMYDPDTKEILLLNWHKYNWTSSQKFKSALQKEIEGIKNDSFREYLTAIFNGEDTVSVSEIYAENTSDTESETVTPKRSSTFVPPTVEEVRAYCRERKNNIDADSFVNFYQSKGWMVGKSKMKDWQACVRTWEKNEKNGGGTARQQTTPKVANQFADFPQRDKTDIDFADLERRKSGFK